MYAIKDLLEKSKTCFHAVSEAAKILDENGFVKLFESDDFNLNNGGKYYVVRNNSALIAFVVSKEKQYGYRIVASHTDSPCFKVKFGKSSTSAGCTLAYVEQYGGGLRYTWFDRPLKLCGRLCGEKDGKIIECLYQSEKRFVIPSLAIHYNRSANDGIPFNVQTDCRPIYALQVDVDLLKKDLENAFDGRLFDCDLYLVCDEQPFYAGRDNELLCSPRVDNLTSCFASIEGLCASEANDNMTTVAYLADNEEVGSRTKQGAGSAFLLNVLERISASQNQSIYQNLSNTFMLSCDNAHATHPCHAQLADGSNDVFLGCGVVIKHHANMNYTSDGLSSAKFKKILIDAGIPFCDFYMRSDLPCGGTLGAISSAHVSVESVDIGIAQLAMHSAVETFAIKDYDCMVNAIKAFNNAS